MWVDNLVRLGAVVLVATAPALVVQAQVTVNVNDQLQEIHGFGVSQAFGRAAELRDLISDELTNKALDLMFNRTTGAGLSIIRNRIGSGEAADNMMQRNNPGGPNATPKYSWDGDDQGQVWFSHRAMEYGIKTIYADAWSAPGYMKTNGNQANGGYLCGSPGHSCASGDWRAAYADFLVQYIKYNAQDGIPVTHVGFLNEPDLTVSYSSMQMSGSEAANFIPILNSALEKAGFSNVTIVCCDTMGWGSARTWTSQLVGAGAHRQGLGIISSHGYTGEPTSPLNGAPVPVWQTEYAPEAPWCTTWFQSGGACEGMTWANKLHAGIVNANLSAYINWQGAEVNQFQASTYLVASDARTVTPSGRLWAYAMWSRYVRPGARRLGTSGNIQGVGVGAFKNTDGTYAVVMTNNGGAATRARLSFSGGDFVPRISMAYLTDNSHSVEKTESSVEDGVASVGVPARSVVTIIVR